jgi:YjbE family integral membrane protein
MMEYLASPEVWAKLLTIIGIDIILSGDNAVVIALACRSLPPQQQRWGITLGAGAAVALRILFTIFIAYLIMVPYLRIIGGALLFWVGYKLIVGEDADEDIKPADSLWHAIRIIVVADAVMSLDNVIAVAAAAKGDVVLLIAGLLISIPLVVYGATLMLKLIARYPFIVPGGAALIGYIGGEVIVSDQVIEGWIKANASWLHDFGPLIGAIFVIVFSRLVAPAQQAAVNAGEVAKEAAAGAALFLARAGLTRLAAFIVGAVAYSMGDAASVEGGGVAVQVMHGLRPVFAAVIAIMIGEAIAWAMRRARG